MSVLEAAAKAKASAKDKAKTKDKWKASAVCQAAKASVLQPQSGLSSRWESDHSLARRYPWFSVLSEREQCNLALVEAFLV